MPNPNRSKVIVPKECGSCKGEVNDKGICTKCGADYLALVDIFSIPATATKKDRMIGS